MSACAVSVSVLHRARGRFLRIVAGVRSAGAVSVGALHKVRISFFRIGKLWILSVEERGLTLGSAPWNSVIDSLFCNELRC